MLSASCRPAGHGSATRKPAGHWLAPLSNGSQSKCRRAQRGNDVERGRRDTSRSRIRNVTRHCKPAARPGGSNALAHRAVHVHGYPYIPATASRRAATRMTCHMPGAVHAMRTDRTTSRPRDERGACPSSAGARAPDWRSTTHTPATCCDATDKSKRVNRASHSASVSRAFSAPQPRLLRHAIAHTV